MDNKVVVLRASRQKLIDNLRDCLERAERGEVIDFAFTWVNATSSFTAYGTTDYATRLLGAMRLLEQTVLLGQMDV